MTGRLERKKIRNGNKDLRRRFARNPVDALESEWFRLQGVLGLVGEGSGAQ